MTTTPPRRSAPRTAAVALIALLLATAAPATASPGSSPASPALRTITYEVRAAGGPQADLAVFARTAARALNDRRGWSLGGAVRFRQVPTGGDFSLWLASPSAVAAFSPSCTRQYSCRVGRNVVINDERWRLGTSTWPQVAEYRRYVLNHELGHWLGLGHSGCPGRGSAAPVMQQQSIGLDGCERRTWPSPTERQAVAKRLGVALRSPWADLYALAEDTGRLHVLAGQDAHRRTSASYQVQLPRAAPGVWEHLVADRDADGVDDLVSVLRTGSSGRTEVHVLDGASGYRSWQAQVATALPVTGGTWSFDLADVDGDAVLDLVALARAGASGRTEVHVLDGARQYGAFLLQTTTPLQRTDRGGWTLRLGDADADGRADLHAVLGSGATGRTEVHVLGGAKDFSTWSSHHATALGPTGSSWSVAVDDVDGDARADLVAVAREGSDGMTDVHVLGAADGFGRYLLQTPTALAATDRDRWQFGVD